MNAQTNSWTYEPDPAIANGEPNRQATPHPQTPHPQTPHPQTPHPQASSSDRQSNRQSFKTQPLDNTQVLLEWLKCGEMERRSTSLAKWYARKRAVHQRRVIDICRSSPGGTIHYQAQDKKQAALLGERGLILVISDGKDQRFAKKMGKLDITHEQLELSGKAVAKVLARANALQLLQEMVEEEKAIQLAAKAAKDAEADEGFPPGQEQYRSIKAKRKYPSAVSTEKRKKKQYVDSCREIIPDEILESWAAACEDAVEMDPVLENPVLENAQTDNSIYRRDDPANPANPANCTPSTVFPPYKL
jgi:hypothetical protein